VGPSGKGGAFGLSGVQNTLLHGHAAGTEFGDEVIVQGLTVGVVVVKGGVEEERTPFNVDISVGKLLDGLADALRANVTPGSTWRRSCRWRRWRRGGQGWL
jgi:hypothetical protein